MWWDLFDAVVLAVVVALFLVVSALITFLVAFQGTDAVCNVISRHRKSSAY